MREPLQNAIFSRLNEGDGGYTTGAAGPSARRYTPTQEKLWPRSFIRLVGEAIHPPEPPPLFVTYKPVAATESWRLYNKSNWMSLAIHTCVVVLLFTMASSQAVPNTANRVVSTVAPDIAFYIPNLDQGTQLMGVGGGGGDRSPTPASRGRLPEPATKQFTPPMVVATQNPELLMEPTIIAPPDTPVPNVNLANWGDPLAKVDQSSNGPGSGGGIGSGAGGGVRPGNGGGYGPGDGDGVVAGVFGVGGGVSAPEVLYEVDPEYSEEACKAKYAGTVVLQVVVDATGKAQHIRVTRGLGLGLDENAIKAVNKWTFRPGYRNGQPVAVIATIEVSFHLL